MGLSKYVPDFVTSGINDRRITSRRLPSFLLRFFWSQPSLYRIYSRLQHEIDIYHLDCDYVFDGFPRSANSFGSRMLAVTQGGNIKVLSNAHCPPFLLGALHAGQPVCLTIRAPADAAVSWYLLKKELSMESILELYLNFYTVMLPYRTRVLILPFSLVTTNFSAVLQLINKRFARSLQIPDDLGDIQQTVFEEIDTHYENEANGYDPLKVARPHEEREKLKASAREKLLSSRCQKLLQQCERLYALLEAEHRHQVSFLKIAALNPVLT